MPAPGDQVGRYVIDAPLGRGGEAAVFIAHDPSGGQRVVLKFLEPSQLGDVAAFERMRREVAIGRDLRHPGVPRLIEAHEDGRPPYLVLAYTPGRSLREVLEREDPLAVPRALAIATSLADVVAYCHTHHVYHRDLKPENIVVGDDGRVTIIDFGIALLDGAPRVTWRGFSGLIGTPEYMAPEQIRGERGGPATDVYAAGVILYEMLAGRPPFRSTNPLATMYQHLNMRPEPLDRVRSDVPRPVAAVVARALRRRPEERFADGTALLEALRSPERVDPAVLDQPDPPLGSPLREGLMRHPFVILGLVGLTAAVLVLLAEALLRR
jgi:eukaryotic-like serine/threonine-protein kinase